MKTDKNVYPDIGRRIRERRKKLGLTQAQLCGDYMTRNMLSRIETGDAHPSLDTLLYISQKLKMPPSFFLCRDNMEEAEYTKAVRVKDARRFFGTGQLKKCLDVCEELPSDDDEVSAIKAGARILNAIALFDRGELREARANLEKAEDAIHSTVYLYDESISQIKLIRSLFNSLSKGEPLEPADLPSAPPIYFSKDRYLYILALSLGENGTHIKHALSEGSVYKKHLEARELMAGGSFAEAALILDVIFNDAPDCYLEYFTLLDLEICCRESEDYKTAYRLAEIRADLHDKYSK